jgi:hypothetical protein
VRELVQGEELERCRRVLGTLLAEPFDS